MSILGQLGAELAGVFYALLGALPYVAIYIGVVLLLSLIHI